MKEIILLILIAGSCQQKSVIEDKFSIKDNHYFTLRQVVLYDTIYQHIEVDVIKFNHFQIGQTYAQ